MIDKIKLIITLNVGKTDYISLRKFYWPIKLPDSIRNTNDVDLFHIRIFKLLIKKRFFNVQL